MTTIEFQFQLINFQNGLLRFAFKLTTNYDDAKDLVQETFLKALKYREKLVHESNFKAWIYTIMKNTFINNYRHSSSNKLYHNSSYNSFFIGQIRSSGHYDPDSVYLSKELEKTIESLEINLKLPFKMYHEGFKYREIAETLDMKIGTVKSRIFIARQKLMGQLSD